TPRERELLDAYAGYLAVPVRVADDPAVWIGSGLRTVVISSGALEALDEEATFGLLAHADVQRRSAWLIRAGCVWLGNLPLLAAWGLDLAIAKLAELLADVIGQALLPMQLSREGFVTWTGRVVAALGLGLLLGWAMVPVLGALLAREAHWIEADADRVIVKGGLGQHLLEGLEHPAMLDATPPAGFLRLLVNPSAPRARRINTVARLLDEA